ncbi:FtsX-like permease family protein [Buchnera aphidicola]|uniref:FtsX-like permease family protein n=1 Tax=Buchnera aphidicola TaxID=9 RepID=UPI000B2BFE21|nr:FtsX-like permease family protein [Buchnera aphidicola]
MIVFNKKENLTKFNLQYFSLEVIGTFKENGILDSNIGYIPFEFFQKFLIREDDIDKIELYMFNPFDANKIIINIAKKIHTPLFLYTWINDYKYIYHDINVMKAIIYLFLLLLIIISCFSITSISLMTISKKTQEIAILRSMGANNFLIQIIFLYYGIRSIIISSMIGIFLSLISILNFKNIIFFLEYFFKKSILLDNIYYKNFFLLELNLFDVSVVFINILIIGIITNWYPAYYASRLNPSEILKEY